MTVEIISYSIPGTGPGSNSPPLDLQSDRYLKSDMLLTALRGPVYVLYCKMYIHTDIYSNKEETTDFHGIVSFNPVKMLQQR